MERLERRIAAGEARHVELERGVGDLREIGRAICALANGGGGVVILGVEEDGTIAGVREPPELVQERLTAFLHNGLSAPVSAGLDRAATPRGRFHWVEVPRQRSFEPLRCNGPVWVRRARSSVEPSPPAGSLQGSSEPRTFP